MTPPEPTLLTPEQVMLLDAGPLKELAAKADSIVSAIDDATKGMHRSITNLDWKGEASRSASTRADREKAQMGAVSTKYHTLHDLGGQAHAALNPNITGLKSSLRTLQMANYAVDPDWTVRDLLAAEDSDREQEAKNESTRLLGIARQLGYDLDSYGAKLAEAVAAITPLAPQTAGLNGSAGAQAAKDLREGRMTPEEVAELGAATNLSDQEIEALKRGEPVELPQGQYDYLNEFLRGLDGMSPQEIEGISGALPPGTVADSMQVMSNPQVSAAGTAGVDKGGVDRLPSEVRTLVTDNPVPLTMDRYSSFSALNRVMRDGNPSLEQGTDLDRAILKQGSEIAAAPMPDRAMNEQMSMVGPSLKTDLADELLSSGAGDRTAVHDFFTGKNMEVTCPGGSYNADQHAMAIMQTPWGGGHHGAQEMVNWVGNEAGSADPYVNTMAGETAQSIAGFLVNHEERLSQDTSAGPALGALNPNLTATVAQSLSPYVGNFAGVPDKDGLLLNHNAAPMGTSDDLSKVFKVLDSNPESARIINTAGAQWQNHLAYQSGATDNPHLGHHVGVIDTAMRKGMTHELEYLKNADKWDAIQTYNRAGGIIDSTGAFSSLFAGPLGAVGGVVGPQIKNEILANPDDSTRPIPESERISILENMESDLVRTDPTQLQRNYANGYLQAHPEAASNFAPGLYEPPATQPGPVQHQPGATEPLPPQRPPVPQLGWNQVQNNLEAFANRYLALPQSGDFENQITSGQKDPNIDLRQPEIDGRDGPPHK